MSCQRVNFKVGFPSHPITSNLEAKMSLASAALAGERHVPADFSRKSSLLRQFEPRGVEGEAESVIFPL